MNNDHIFLEYLFKNIYGTSSIAGIVQKIF